MANNDCIYSSDSPLEASAKINVRIGFVALVDSIDADLSDIRWNVNKNGRTHYAMHNNKKSFCYMHRVIMARVLGRDLQRGECVDHVDGDGLNNRRSNLRIASYGENQRNQRRNRANTSGYKGVHWNKLKNKWQARIQVNGNRITLGYFDDPKDGHEAYCKAANELFGEFARAE